MTRPLYRSGVAGRASIVGAAVSHVGNVRAHNEDSHFIDADEGLFVVCDGMGGHAAGEVASALAVNVIRDKWASNEVHNAAARWLQKGSPESRKQLIDQIRGGVAAAHGAILEEAARDEAKTGMGTTLVGAVVVGGDCVFAHAGDSRAYLVRDGIAMQLTEDHTLLARLMAAGVEVDTTGEGSRFKSMLTNALGIGPECKVTTFIVPLADGDRFLLCSDGVSEYVSEAEVGEILCKQPSPARAAQKLVDFALERGGADNATALVVRVLEAGERPQSASERKKDDLAIAQCPLYVKLSPQQRLRAQRIALPREYPAGEKLPAQTLGDRVAWIVIEGEVALDGKTAGPGALIYPESLSPDRPMPDRDGLYTVTADLRALALRSDDFREICVDDEELTEALLAGLLSVLPPPPPSPELATAQTVRVMNAVAPPPDDPMPSPVASAPAPAPVVQHIVIGQPGVDASRATDPDIQLPIAVPSKPARASSESDTAALVTDSPAMHADPKHVTTVPPPMRRLPSMQMRTVVLPDPEPELVTDPGGDPSADVDESDLDRVPTVVGPPPVAAVEERASTEPVEEPTPIPRVPMTLDLDALPEVPTAVKKRPVAPTPPVPTPVIPLPRLPQPPPSLRTAPAVPMPAGRPFAPAATSAIPARVVDAPSASIDIDVDDPELEPTGEKAPLAALPPLSDDTGDEIVAELVAEDPEDPPAPPPPPHRPPARVVSSETSAMASGSIGGGRSGSARARAAAHDDAAQRHEAARSRRISEGWE